VNKLYLKHRLVTSPAGVPLLNLRHRLSRFRYLRHPELALLREEETMIHTLIQRSVTPDSVCVDVGGHIGSISDVFRRAAPGGRQVIVEASPTKADWLRQAFPGAEVHQVAVSDSEGDVSFFENLDQSGFSSLRARDTRGRVQKIDVRCTTLDLLLKDLPRVDFIKIDVEGFEHSVVRGAQEILRRHRPVMLFEAGAATDADIDNEEYVRLFSLLTGPLDYEIRPVFGDIYGKAPISLEEFGAMRTYPFMAFNYVARPKQVSAA